MELFN